MLYYYCWQLNAALSLLRPIQLRTLLSSNICKSSLFTPFQEVQISLESFLTTSSHPIHGRPAFFFTVDDWLTKTIFANPLSVEWVLAILIFFSVPFTVWNTFSRTGTQTIRRHSYRKYLANPPLFLGNPLFTTISYHCHNCSFEYSHLGLQTYTLVLPDFFFPNCGKTPWPLAVNIFTAPIVFTSNTFYVS